MLGVLMLFSFLIPLAGALAIRRFAWVGAWFGVSAIVAAPVLYKLATRTYDPMGWGFVIVLIFMPAAAGSALGMSVTSLRRWASGPGDVSMLNVILAIIWTSLTIGLGLFMASEV